MPPVLMWRVSANIEREFAVTVARTFVRTRRLPRWSGCCADMAADGSRGTQFLQQKKRKEWVPGKGRMTRAATPWAQFVPPWGLSHFGNRHWAQCSRLLFRLPKPE